MPPKKQDAVLPEVEDEVVLPEELLQEIGTPPEPDFSLVLGHLAGHSFKVASETGVQDFEPCNLVLTQAKQLGDASGPVVLLEREELHAYCTEANGLQDQPLWAGLKLRLAKERAARRRAKSNEARRQLIAKFENRDRENRDEGAPEAEAPPEVDVLFLLEAPDAEELNAMSDAGLYEVVDLWCNIYFAGKTVDETDPSVQVDCPTPEQAQLFYEAIQSAPANSDLANCSVVTVPESHALAVAEDESSPSERVMAAMQEVLAREASSRVQFQAWLQAERVKLPDEDTGIFEDRLYHSMMSAVNPAYHDVPLFLHCLTEQVRLHKCPSISVEFSVVPRIQHCTRFY